MMVLMGKVAPVPSYSRRFYFVPVKVLMGALISNIYQQKYGSHFVKTMVLMGAGGMVLDGIRLYWMVLVVLECIGWY